jgi:hypothetical protein
MFVDRHAGDVRDEHEAALWRRVLEMLARGDCPWRDVSAIALAALGEGRSYAEQQKALEGDDDYVCRGQTAGATQQVEAEAKTDPDA